MSAQPVQLAIASETTHGLNLASEAGDGWTLPLVASAILGILPLSNVTVVKPTWLLTDPEGSVRPATAHGREPSAKMVCHPEH